MHASRWTRRHTLAVLASAAIPATLRAQQTVYPAGTSWLSDLQRPPTRIPPDVPALTPLMTIDHKPIGTLKEWTLKRELLIRQWRAALKPWSLSRGSAPTVSIVKQDRVEGVVRQLVQYQVEPGLPVEAYVLRPERATGRVPGVAVFHSTYNASIRQPSGVEGEPAKAFGVQLAKQGCVAFCPRNFLWPENRRMDKTEVGRLYQRHPGTTGMAKMLYDAQVAVDILAADAQVDAQRLGAVGHSLGAKEVLYLAAFDERIKATVSSEGGIGTSYSNWEADWYLGPAVRQPGYGREHHELLGLVAPRAFLLMGGDSADGDRSWPFIEAALPVYRLYPGQPRIGLFNHRKGHSVPPEAEELLYRWLKTYL